MGEIDTIGMVLHPERDSAEAVDTILHWAAGHGTTVLGLADEVARLNCAAVPVSAEGLGTSSQLIVGLGGDGTVLRAMRISDGHGAPVLGVNLGKLGFLAEVDVGDLAAALSSIDDHDFTVENRLAVDASNGEVTVTAFNDLALVRVPGDGLAAVRLLVGEEPFVDYSADAVIVATPTGSTAYNLSAGGPIVSPSVEALLVTPSAPHTVFNRSLIVDADRRLGLEVLAGSGRLAMEVDGRVLCEVGPGDTVSVRARPGAARVVRLGSGTFYQRARRKLGLSGSAELDSLPPPPVGDGD